jgi:trehalose 6-phosphate phosphatase
VLQGLLAPFVERPARAGVVSDFDGTLAPIVDDPAEARALPGAVDALHRLARRYAVVAVVSGRPVGFLAERLGLADRAAGDGSDRLVVSGLYGLEKAVGTVVERHPEAAGWETVVEQAAHDAESQAPAGVRVERKGLSVTVHVREAPEHDAWAGAWCQARAVVTGLVMHPARLSYELRPPIEVDKGTVVAGRVSGLDAACFLGDDRGDIPAFDALGRLAEETGASVLRVGVRSAEAPAGLLDRADLVVDGPDGALALLRRLLGEAGPEP